MKYLSFLSLLTWTFLSIAQDKGPLIDPESINTTTRLLSYNISIKDIKISSYGGAHPSHIQVTLCKKCKPTIYPLNKETQLEYYGIPFDISKLTKHFLDKDFSIVGIGLNRDKGVITRISLNPVNKEISDIDLVGKPL